MSKPRILVLAAVGRTGMPIVLQLLDEGFPVTAFVHKADQRSERLKAKGADIVVGSLTDINDMRTAMAGATRAYFCVPNEAGNLKAATIFTVVAAEQKLEAIVAMSMWLSNPNHPSIHTRETWLADRLFELLPGTAVTFINPGFFADNEMQFLPFAAQSGLLSLPYGSGLNAPPSNEDMARVVAEILARPEGHAGKTYRPTGPKLLSPQEIAAILGKVLGRKVTYRNTPMQMLSKIMRSQLSLYNLAIYEQYVIDYQKNAFAVNAPTDVVRRITGREAEDFETIARRYAATTPEARRSFATQFKLMLMMIFSMLRSAPRTAPYLALDEFSQRSHVVFSADSPEWRRSHDPQVKETFSDKATFQHSGL
ncbi:NmrA family transcriptional regulator [Reticulibacter mediterranei]|uniref:NmrA family transcriptional regulator n=1 Tax=Reticulibacter mediterranei TaxID=2778369 RepID=A0A8J3IP39_9CHLR|nr:NmrA family NAD(P)-binding protein [Reticulibacter mediterranei]GHO99284.1 NmrA family transcriptional regulator [Reticulibacter mediterranei]